MRLILHRTLRKIIDILETMSTVTSTTDSPFMMLSQLDQDTSIASSSIRKRNSFVDINRIPVGILSSIPSLPSGGMSPRQFRTRLLARNIPSACRAVARNDLSRMVGSM